MVNPRRDAQQGELRGPGEHRLRRRAEYLTAYEQGRKAHGRLVVIFARRREEGGAWRLGLTATRKLGGAVVRNRLRRRAREIFRRWGARLPAGWDFVLNFKHGAAASSHDELLRDLLASLRRLGADPEPPAADAGPTPQPERTPEPSS